MADDSTTVPCTMVPAFGSKGPGTGVRSLAYGGVWVLGVASGVGQAVRKGEGVPQAQEQCGSLAASGNLGPPPKRCWLWLPMDVTAHKVGKGLQFG